MPTMTTAKPPIDIPPLPPSVLNYQLPPLEEQKAATNGKSLGNPLPPTPPRRKFWGLRPKLITSAVALATVPMIGVGLAANEVARQQLMRQVLGVQQQESMASSLSFDQYLRERQGDASTLAFLLTSRYGTEIQRRDRPPLQAILDQLIKAYRDYDSAAIIANDGQGTVIAQSTAGNRLANNVLQNQEYFKLAIQTRKAVLTVEPTLSLPERPLGMFAAAPLINPQNQQIMAVVRLRVPRSG
ncbi:MAG: chemotaxis protein, partial [Chloroflexi bacterium]